MTKEDEIIVADEIAKTFDLYGFEMSYAEFKDIFELGAEFGYQLALINKSSEVKNECVKSSMNLTFKKNNFNFK